MRDTAKSATGRPWLHWRPGQTPSPLYIEVLTLAQDFKKVFPHQHLAVFEELSERPHRRSGISDHRRHRAPPGGSDEAIRGPMTIVGREIVLSSPLNCSRFCSDISTKAIPMPR